MFSISRGHCYSITHHVNNEDIAHARKMVKVMGKLSSGEQLTKLERFTLAWDGIKNWFTHSKIKLEAREQLVILFDMQEQLKSTDLSPSERLRLERSAHRAFLHLYSLTPGGCEGNFPINPSETEFSIVSDAVLRRPEQAEYGAGDLSHQDASNILSFSMQLTYVNCRSGSLRPEYGQHREAEDRRLFVRSALARSAKLNGDTCMRAISASLAQKGSTLQLNELRSALEYYKDQSADARSLLAATDIATARDLVTREAQGENIEAARQQFIKDLQKIRTRLLRGGFHDPS